MKNLTQKQKDTILVIESLIYTLEQDQQYTVLKQYDFTDLERQIIINSLKLRYNLITGYIYE